MYTIMGVAGQVGAAVANTLLAANEQVRVVVRDTQKGAAWAAQGCEVAVADATDLQSLAAAFKNSQGVFILLPPNFDPVEGFPQTREIIANIHQALAMTRPGKVVCISTIGAQASQPNLLNQLQLLEQSLHQLDLPITFLRPAWFMENHQWDIEAAKSGVIPSFLQPLDKPVPMIATLDVGRTAAELLRETWQGKRVVELQATETVTPDSIAQAFTELLGHPVRMQVVPRDTWEGLFHSQGMHNPHPRMQMLDGFNEGWICFEGVPRAGRVTFKEVLAGLLGR
ncbi:NmrA family NAD(P)-binding protein [Pseudomonas tolaasii]|uniref:NmrA family NAD(P)-binding protein n=1 Tax=Pseudomonas tolaasii TaxID=29442 RepID=UPI0015A05469|nr:NmrA family NAD(P)-binding protein [Pseudomonas tolaasii]NVZ45751.1 NmrA family NAD(P)-binding protein [Pseudomonas tolaasii]NWA49677.1 NmrA family NAD(P)-binding protein [Pseudomonas tolaasii]